MFDDVLAPFYLSKSNKNFITFLHVFIVVLKHGISQGFLVLILEFRRFKLACSLRSCRLHFLQKKAGRGWLICCARRYGLSPYGIVLVDRH